MKVLIAEDNPIHQMILEDYLKDTHFDVLTAVNGEIAWELWKEHAPEIVVTDINMPLMDGYALIQLIRDHEIGTHTHIITITSKQDVDELERSYDSGSDDFMFKPIQEKELIYRLKVGERANTNSDKKAFFDTLAKLTELRDSDTGGHVKRISDFTRIIALTMKNHPQYAEIMTETYIKNLVFSSILHDIGKIAMDDDLLKSTTIYTPEERKRMQKHTIFGSQFLHEVKTIHPNMGFLDLAISIARSHHEKYDGSGYPDGLKGENIPLEARIVAVADVFDALISRRAYKEPFPIQKTIEIIKKESGRHFDPSIVSIMLESLPLILKKVYRITDGGNLE